jgi:hypothetical protein
MDCVYAINHAATALPIKRMFPDVPLPALLVGGQLTELLRVALQFSGKEHFTVRNDDVHLDFLPYSHFLLAGRREPEGVCPGSRGRRNAVFMSGA